MDSRTHPDKQEEKKKSHSMNVGNTMVGIFFRSLFATPWDNVTKRVQLYDGPIGLKEIPHLFFMDAKAGSLIQKIKAMYSAYGFGVPYKGVQITAFFYTLEALKPWVQEKLGKNKTADIISALGASVVQTGLLQAPGVVRTRLQVDPSLTFWQALTKNKEYAYPWQVPKDKLGAEICRSNLSAGTTANFARAFAYFSASTLTDSFLQSFLVTYKIGGSEEQPTQMQKNISKIGSAIAGCWWSVFFDNAKTKLSVIGSSPNQPTLSLFMMILEDYKKHGLWRNFRPIPSGFIAEAFAVLGFVAGMQAVDFCRNGNEEPKSQTLQKR